MLYPSVSSILSPKKQERKVFLYCFFSLNVSESIMAVLRISAAALAMVVMMMGSIGADDTNHVYSPCSDTKITRSDGFTFGIAFAPRNSFFFNASLQLSPCDRRLSFPSTSQISVFRPKVDEISLLTVNSSSFLPVSSLRTSNSRSRLIIGLEMIC